MEVGRPRTPVERARKLGNPGKRDLPAPSEVAEIAPVETTAPAHLSETGAALWDHVVRAAVWLGESDRPTLVLLCEKYDRREIWKELLAQQDPVLYTDKMYAYANPLVGMLSTLETDIAKLFSALGLTPTDRTRMGVAEVKAKNAFEEMMARRGSAL